MTQATRKRAFDIDPRILEIFDGYVHSRVSKREFIAQAGRYAAAGVTGAMILEQLQPNYALAQRVAPDDPAIVTETVEYPSPEGHGTVRALMARPAGVSGQLPAVLVVHENRGLNPYIEDVVRRTAKAGYLALVEARVAGRASPRSHGAPATWPRASGGGCARWPTRSSEFRASAGFSRPARAQRSCRSGRVRRYRRMPSRTRSHKSRRATR